MTTIERIECEADFNALLQRVRKEQGLSHMDVEHAVGLTTGHLGKIENGDKSWGKQILRLKQEKVSMTQTVPWLLEALGLRLLVVDQETAEALAKPKIAQLERKHVDKATSLERPTRKRLSVRWTTRPS